MVMVLEQKLVNQIADIGKTRRPNEACGLLLPTEVNRVQVIEIPNRSKKPRDSFTMLGTDMLLALEMVFRGEVPENIIPGLTTWHTHPKGNVGPSRYDLQNKPAMVKSLVVTVFDDDRPPLATWF